MKPFNFFTTDITTSCSCECRLVITSEGRWGLVFVNDGFRFIFLTFLSSSAVELESLPVFSEENAESDRAFFFLLITFLLLNLVRKLNSSMLCLGLVILKRLEHVDSLKTTDIEEPSVLSFSDTSLLTSCSLFRFCVTSELSEIALLVALEFEELSDFSLLLRHFFGVFCDSSTEWFFLLRPCNFFVFFRHLCGCAIWCIV